MHKNKTGFQKTANRHKKEEDTLRESEERFRREQKFGQLLLDDSPAYIVAIGSDGETLMMNKSLLHTLEYTQEEIKGADYLTTFVPEDDRIRLGGVFQKIIKEGKSTVNENRIISRSGRIYIVEWHGRPAAWEGIDGDFFFGVGIDITDRKNSEKSFRTIFERSPVGKSLTATNGKLLQINKTFADMLGYTIQELEQHNLAQITHPEDMEESRKCIRVLLENEQTVYRMEKRYIHKNGSIIWADVSTTLIRDEQGTPLHLITSIVDITQRKQAEDNLRKSEKEFRALAESMPQIVWVTRKDGWNIYFNQQWVDYTGLTLEESYGHGWNIPFHPDDKQRAWDAWQNATKNNGIYSIECRLRRADGVYHWWLIRGVPLLDETGEIIKWFGTCTDIDNIKLAEKQLLDTLERLRKSFGVTIQVMVSAIEVRDPYTAGHQKRVADLARSIATEMGLDRDIIEGIRMAGAIHDIGKLAIPSEILAKPTKLTNIEFSLIKEHSQSGYEMLKDVESPWPLAQIVYQHHERINGSGYPRKLKGDEIIIEARIMAVADVVEAMASHRPYRPGLGLEAALEEIEKNKGILYDDVVADACLKLFREKGYQLK